MLFFARDFFLELQIHVFQKHLKVKTSWIPGILQKSWTCKLGTCQTPQYSLQATRCPCEACHAAGYANVVAVQLFFHRLFGGRNLIQWFWVSRVPKNWSNFIFSHNWFWGGLIMFRYQKPKDLPVVKKPSFHQPPSRPAISLTAAFWITFPPQSM